jgi:uncharacterized protein YoxC
MNTILLVVIAVCVLAIAFFLIPVLTELQKTLASLRKATDEGLKPALEELQATLKSARVISDDVGGITSDIREVSRSVVEIGHKVSAINGLLETAGSSVTLRAAGLKAGIRAAIEYLVKNLIRKGDRK